MTNKYKMLRVCATDLFAKTALLPEIDFLQKKGWSIDIAFPEDKETKSLLKNNYKVVLINDARNISFISNIKTIIHLYRLIKTKKYDIVHTHNHLIGVLARIAAKLAGAPKIVHSPHGFYFHENMHPFIFWIFHTIERCMGMLTDLVFIENKENVEMCNKTHLIPTKKIYYIGGGIDMVRFNGRNLNFKQKVFLMKKLKISSQSFPIIGITSRLTYEKGYRELIQSIVQIRNQFPNVHLLVVGAILKNERDNFYLELQELVVKHSLQRNITITLDHNVEDFLRLMDIFTLPSYREGLPRSIQEAMAMALPVVATDIRGCRDLVKNNKTGLLVPPKNVEELTQALLKLINNKELRESYGKAGRIYAGKYYSNRIVFDRMLNGYKSIISIKD